MALALCGRGRAHKFYFARPDSGLKYVDARDKPGHDEFF